MIRVNLLPVKEIKAEVTRRRDLTFAGITVGATILVLVGLYFYQSYRMTNLNRELAGLRQEIQSLNLKVKEVGELQAKIKEYNSKYGIIEDLRKKKTGPVRVMESLASATPATLWLTELKESNGSLLMNGMATDNQAVAEFLRNLGTFSYFRDVELVETTQADEKTGRYKKFSVKSAISYHGTDRPTKAQQDPAAKGNKG